MRTTTPLLFKVLLTIALVLATVSAIGPVVMMRVELAYPGIEWLSGSAQYEALSTLHQLASTYFLLPVLIGCLVPYWVLHRFYNGFNTKTCRVLVTLGVLFLIFGNVLLIATLATEVFSISKPTWTIYPPLSASANYDIQTMFFGIYLAVRMSCLGFILLCLTYLVTACQTLRLSTEIGKAVAFIAVLEMLRTVLIALKLSTTSLLRDFYQVEFFSDVSPSSILSTFVDVLSLPVFALAGIAIWLAHKAKKLALLPIILAIVAVLVFAGTQNIVRLDKLILSQTVFASSSSHSLFAAVPFLLMTAAGWLYVRCQQFSIKQAIAWWGTAAIAICSMGVFLWAGFSLGLRGMPRMYPDYPDFYATDQLIQSIAVLVFFCSCIVMLILTLISKPNKTHELKQPTSFLAKLFE